VLTAGSFVNELLLAALALKKILATSRSPIPFTEHEFAAAATEPLLDLTLLPVS